MGWTISHGTTTRSGNLYRSASAMGDVARHVSHILSASEWREVQGLFRQANSGRGPFAISPRDAARMAELLHKAATDRRMPKRDSKDDLCCSAWVHELADAAQHAARTGQPWQWS
jgi:hypothetical protein